MVGYENTGWSRKQDGFRPVSWQQQGCALSFMRKCVKTWVSMGGGGVEVSPSTACCCQKELGLKFTKKFKQNS